MLPPVVRLIDLPGGGPTFEFLGESGRAGRANRRAAWVLVPSAHVLVTRAELPPTRRARMLQAAPYALEEHLSQDVESLHFALAEHDGETGAGVAVVARERMRAWVRALETAGIQAAVMLPDTLALPWSPGRVSILLEDEMALVRTGRCAGFAVESENLEPFLRAAVAARANEPPAAIDVYLADGSGATARAPESLHALGVPIREHGGHGGAGRWLTAGARGPAPIDLLQGPFAPPRPGTARAWRVALAMLTLVIAARASLVVLETQALREDARDLAREVESLYTQAFPGESAPPDARARMEAALSALRRQGSQRRDDLLSLLAIAAPPLAASRGLELERVELREGRLELDLSAADVTGFDDLKSALVAAPGVELEVVSATSLGDSVETRLRIWERR